MSQATAFWDSSALIPLCVQEQNSGQARTFAKQYAQVVWWATPVEIHSAINRLHRAEDLTDETQQAALNRLAALSRGWREVLPSDKLRDLARHLATRYPLRAADSLQLTAAMIWCRERPARRVFLSGDARLCEAASRAGFAVSQL